MAECKSSDALAPSSQFANKSRSTLRKGKKDDLDERQPIPAWKLRERMKNESRPIYQPRAVSRTPLLGNGSLDPSLPPAFQAVAAKQRKKEQDDFMSLDSVHSSKTQRSMLTNDDSNSDPEYSDSLSDEDSFASLGENEEDDEAYREGRNQMARQTLESVQSTRPRAPRLKKGGINSRPLDLIAE